MTLKSFKSFLSRLLPRNSILHFLNDISYRKKLFLSYLMVVIIPIALLGGYAYCRASDYLQEQALIGLDSSVSLLSSDLTSKLKIYNKSIAYVANDTQIISIINQDIVGYFEKYVDLVLTIQPLINNTKFLTDDLDSITIYSTNELISDRIPAIQSMSKISNETWYDEAINSRKVIWRMQGDTLIGSYKIYAPIKRMPVNILVLKITFANILNTSNINASQFHLILYDDYSHIYYLNGMDIPFNDEQIEEISSKGVSRITFDNIDYIMSTKIIDATGWRICCLVPEDELIVDPNGILTTTILIAISCFFLVMLITNFLANALVKRMKVLNDKMKLVEEGNLQVGVSSDDKDEIGQLAARFDKMLAEINHLIDEVYAGKLEQKEAELKALQAQINPHFLYNTLSLINWMAIEVQAENICEVTAKLSSFYRTMLNKGNSFTLLRNELENIQAYIDIQLIAHSNSFDVVYDVDENILGCCIINMILQPIVENAILHGIDEKKDKRGLLRIEASTMSGDIIICVSDNGDGMTPDKVEQIFAISTKGYGIKNVQEKIRLFFGAEYGITFLSSSGIGTTVKIRLPMRYAPQDTQEYDA